MLKKVRTQEIGAPMAIHKDEQSQQRMQLPVTHAADGKKEEASRNLNASPGKRSTKPIYKKGFGVVKKEKLSALFLKMLKEY